MYLVVYDVYVKFLTFLDIFYRICLLLFRCKFTKPSDAVTGNPLVLKMVVNYSRQLSKQNALRDIVGPLILKVFYCFFPGQIVIPLLIHGLGHKSWQLFYFVDICERITNVYVSRGMSAGIVSTTRS